jgi:hypothetical protein
MLRYWWLIALVGLVRAFTPEISYTTHPRLSQNILYFDDAPVVLNLNDMTLFRSEDSGKNWERSLNDIDTIFIDPIKKERAFAFTVGGKHYVTNDRGKTWNEFSVPMASDMAFDLNVNSKDTDQVLLSFLECDDQGSCKTAIYYSIDGFRSDPTVLVKDAAKCLFTKSSDAFDAGDDSRILCLKTERDEHGYVRRSEVITSTDFFATEPQVLNDASGVFAGSYVLDIRIVQSFAVAVVQTDKYDTFGASVFLFVSKDGVNFSKAIMDESLISNGFSFLPSTKDSLHISVWGTNGSNTANILSSDFEGIHFRNLLGQVEGSGLLGFIDVDKVETIEGVWIAKVMEGYDLGSFAPNSRSKITFDDGHSWQYLKTETCNGDESCGLNVLSMQERVGNGQGTTGSTPGILMAIGNEGETLEQDVLKMHTYVSRDGGWTWTKTLEEPCVFAFGDLGNIIVAAPYVKKDQDNLITKKFYYSLDQGANWQTLELEQAVFPSLLTTAIDGTTTNFLYVGLQPVKDGGVKQVIYSLDFNKAFDKTCDEDDFENWFGRSQENDRGSCVFGHRDIYKRRKQDAMCFVNKVFDDLKFEEAPCDCTDADFECSFGFSLNSKGECVPDKSAMLKLCAEASDKELKLKLKRKIPGNMCVGGGVQIDDYTFNCDDDLLKTERIQTIETKFEGKVANYYFMDRADYGTSDETLLVKTTRNVVHISHDAGATFRKFETDDEIVHIYLNPYFKNIVLLISASDKIYMSTNRAKTFLSFSTPSEVNPFGLPIISFDKGNAERFIFFGDEGCDSQFSATCKPVAFITEDSGRNWNPLVRGAKHCDFVGSKYTSLNVDTNLIFCQVHQDGGDSLISSNDKFANQKVLFESIVGFATTSYFTIVASIDGDALQAHVTIDGETFADADFPKDFIVSKQQAYTVLGSETGAIFLHVTTNERPGSEFGAILKSNANGTSYVMSEKHVNRNVFGFVDYERVEGLEGIAIINTVKNFDEAKAGALKQLRSRITFNDGSDWYFIQPPHTDSEGKKYQCIGSPLGECALHLHGYTERRDFRDTFSSGSATGLLLGVGNVGDKLGSFNDASTFITNDGGSTWKEVKKGVYQWEFGDRGSIIVLVNDQSNTNVIHYSLDEGNTWNDYQFTEESVQVTDIVTVPSDTSKKFLLVTRSDSNNGDESRTFTIDFENVFVRQCVLDLEHPDQDDFEYWTPNHPLSASNCLFGHEAKYLRKLRDRVDCFIGSAPMGQAFKVIRDCPCTRHDFECDYNYIKAEDGTCKLVPGLEPEDRSEVCRVDKDAVEYFEPTGYRKIPMSTCQGGQEFDKWNPIPCPGKEREFGKKHSGKLGGFGLAMVIVIPIVVFVLAVWFVYDKGIRRNGGFARFGEIRLGEDDDLIERNLTDKVVNSIVRSGITVIAAAIATYKTVGMMSHGVIETVRNVFARGTRYHTRGAGYTTVGVNDYRDDDDLLGAVLDDEDYEIDDDIEAGPDIHDASEAYTDDRNLE